MLSSKAVANIFPFHILLDADLIIRSVGKDLPQIMGTTRDDMMGTYVDSTFSWTTTAKSHHQWTLPRLVRLGESDDNNYIALEPLLPSTAVTCRLVLTGSVVVLTHKQQQSECLLILTPNPESLHQTNLPAPRFGCTREVKALDEKEDRHHSGEYDTNQADTIMPVTTASGRPTMSSSSTDTRSTPPRIVQQLRIELQRERRLVESLLPKHAADSLRRGGHDHVDPLFHEHVSMFFSDIAGFTHMCDKIFPWEIIGVLNRLYCIMDHLANKFQLYKIETIGDAYVCAAGLPVDDPDHAGKVAAFALAVSHCARHVLSPVDGAPIRLRVGIHSGSCASGVVGVTNPRYCVFGDTVNITSRHESTGEADRVHASESIVKQLVSKCSDKFVVTERGKVDMKGKGQLTTYWLTASDANPTLNPEGLAALDAEVKRVLYDADFGKSKTRGSPTRTMDSFSPGKMQKVALSLDKLAMDVLRKSSLLVNRHAREEEQKGDDTTPFPTLAKHSMNRGNDTLSLAHIDETPPVPTLSHADDDSDAVIDKVYDTLSSIFQSLSDMDKDEFRKSLHEMNSDLFLKLCEENDD